MTYTLRLFDNINTVLALSLSYLTKEDAVAMFEELSCGLKDGFSLAIIAEKEAEE